MDFEHLDLLGYVTEEARYELYDDDGNSKDYENPEHYETITVTSQGAVSQSGKMKKDLENSMESVNKILKSCFDSIYYITFVTLVRFRIRFINSEPYIYRLLYGRKSSLTFWRHIQQHFNQSSLPLHRKPGFQYAPQKTH